MYYPTTIEFFTGILDEMFMISESNMFNASPEPNHDFQYISTKFVSVKKDSETDQFYLWIADSIYIAEHFSTANKACTFLHGSHLVRHPYTHYDDFVNHTMSKFINLFNYRGGRDYLKLKAGDSFSSMLHADKNSEFVYVKGETEHKSLPLYKRTPMLSENDLVEELKTSDNNNTLEESIITSLQALKEIHENTKGFDW